MTRPELRLYTNSADSKKPKDSEEEDYWQPGKKPVSKYPSMTEDFPGFMSSLPGTKTLNIPSSLTIGRLMKAARHTYHGFKLIGLNTSTALSLSIRAAKGSHCCDYLRAHLFLQERR